MNRPSDAVDEHSHGERQEHNHDDGRVQRPAWPTTTMAMTMATATATARVTPTRTPPA